MKLLFSKPTKRKLAQTRSAFVAFAIRECILKLNHNEKFQTDKQTFGLEKAVENIMSDVAILFFVEQNKRVPKHMIKSTLFRITEGVHNKTKNSTSISLV